MTYRCAYLTRVPLPRFRKRLLTLLFVLMVCFSRKTANQALVTGLILPNRGLEGKKRLTRIHRLMM